MDLQDVENADGLKYFAADAQGPWGFGLDDGLLVRQQPTGFGLFRLDGQILEFDYGSVTADIRPQGLDLSDGLFARRQAVGLDFWQQDSQALEPDYGGITTDTWGPYKIGQRNGLLVRWQSTDLDLWRLDDQALGSDYGDVAVDIREPWGFGYCVDWAPSDRIFVAFEHL